MAGNAEQAGSRLKRRSPDEVRVVRASENVQRTRKNVMSNNSTAASNVIPFNFGKQQVRTLLIDDQPWFVAKDVIASLDYAKSSNPARVVDHVPAQWKGVNPIHTLGGAQQILMLSEQGLYFFIGRSDKPKALPFQMWLAGEVLPAIRKHGRYEDAKGKMQPILDELLGPQGARKLGNIMRCRVAKLDTEHQRSATAKLASALHARFDVPRMELIPGDQLDTACNFVAAYAIEGEYLGKEEPEAEPPLNIHFPVEALARRRPEMVKPRGDDHAWLDLSLQDLRDLHEESTPCEAILIELRRAGYEVEGAWWELRTYRNKMQEIASFAHGLTCVIDEPHRYAIKMRDAA